MRKRCMAQRRPCLQRRSSAFRICLDAGAAQQPAVAGIAVLALICGPATGIPCLRSSS
jgi:hypothetical protein